LNVGDGPCVRIQPTTAIIGSDSTPALKVGSSYLGLYTEDKKGVVSSLDDAGYILVRASNSTANGIETIAKFGGGNADFPSGLTTPSGNITSAIIANLSSSTGTIDINSNVEIPVANSLTVPTLIATTLWAASTTINVVGSLSVTSDLTVTGDAEVNGGSLICRANTNPSIILESESGENEDTHIEFREALSNITTPASTHFGMHMSYDGGANCIGFHAIESSVSSERMRINRSSSGAAVVVTGTLSSTNGVCSGSSREYKENVLELDEALACEAIMALEPVAYNYKEDKDQKHLGFIAEDVPELLAMNDRKSLAALDITAAITKVVQKQEKEIKDLKKEITELKNLILN